MAALLSVRLVQISSRRLFLAHWAGATTSCWSTHRRMSSDSSGSWLEASGAVLHKCWASMAQSAPVVMIKEQLCWAHDHLGTEWWAVIVLVTVLVRIGCMLPAHVTAHKVAAKRKLLHEEMETQHIPTMKLSLAYKVQKHDWSNAKANYYFEQMKRELFKKKVLEYNCAASKMYLPFYIQIPGWISLSLALRDLSTGQFGRFTSPEAQLRFQEFSTQGCLWFGNLSLPDHTLVLPILAGLSYLVNIEVAANLQPEKTSTKFHKALRNVFRLCALSMIPFTSLVPAALAFYWATSGFCATIVNLIILSPRFRRAVRIPHLTSEPAHPYSQLAANFASKVGPWLPRAPSRRSRRQSQ